MAELYPMALGPLLERVVREPAVQGTLFDLPKTKFWRPDPAVDTSVYFHGRRALCALGPASGPQSQLAQNIALSWLGGGRIMELKTVQINDTLVIPRPCIWAGNVGYNVEWSQELRIPASLEEYVKGSMIVEILRQEDVLGIAEVRERGQPGDAAGDATIFDLSIGYDLEGIRSEPVTRFIRAMKDATATIDALRPQIPDSLRKYRDFPFEARLARSVTLSTFHGCPADQIERIAAHCLTELGLDTVVKLNPTLLGFDDARGLLHDVMGYTDIELMRDSFEHDLQWADCIAMVRRLQDCARLAGRSLGVKLSNTLVVRQKGGWFPATEASMYLSGPPLHVLTMNLLARIRAAFAGERVNGGGGGGGAGDACAARGGAGTGTGEDISISFSAGIDKHNFPTAVSLDLVPITTCTDLLRTGGYGRMSGYLTNLEARMRAAGARRVPDFILKADTGGGPALDQACDRMAAVLSEEFGERASGALRLLADSRVALQGNLVAAQTDLGGIVEGAVQTLQEVGSPAGIPEIATRAVELMRGVVPRAARQAAVARTEAVVRATTGDKRYHAQSNKAVPRKIGSKLWLYDCISCDKCIPVCPNDANFSYEVGPLDDQCAVMASSGGKLVEIGFERLVIERQHQIANFSDFCNECGNCDVFCPEDGGPFVQKPRFFGSMAAFERHSTHDGFHVGATPAGHSMHGRIRKRRYLLAIPSRPGLHLFEDGTVSLDIEPGGVRVVESRMLSAPPEGYSISLAVYRSMRIILEGVLDARRVHFVNVGLR